GDALRGPIVGVAGRAPDLLVAELAQQRLAALAALRRPAVRRDARRRRDRELLGVLQRGALHLPHAPQIVAERQRRARAHADPHVLPVLAGGVVDDRPA